MSALGISSGLLLSPDIEYAIAEADAWPKTMIAAFGVSAKGGDREVASTCCGSRALKELCGVGTRPDVSVAETNSVGAKLFSTREADVGP